MAIDIITDLAHRRVVAKQLCSGIAATYVADWTVYHGVRELVQNLIDGQAAGYPGKLYRTPGPNGIVHLYTEGCTLSRAKLLMGSTDKPGTGALGIFGEGLKLAMLALIRAGLKVSIASGDEIWIPYIGEADDFGGAQALMYDIRQRYKSGGVKSDGKQEIDIRISGLDQVNWDEMMVTSFLAPNVPGGRTVASLDTRINGTKRVSRLLLDPALRGKLFVGGLFVTQLQGEYAYGYDFCSTLVRTDRDRNMVDPWTLSSSVTKLLQTLTTCNLLTSERVYDMLQADSGEAKAIHSEYVWCSKQDDLTAAVSAVHAKRHGAGALASNDAEDIGKGAAVGLKVVQTSSAIASLVGQVLGTPEAVIAQQAKGAKTVYEINTLDDGELGNLQFAVNALNAGGYAHAIVNSVRVVDFYSSETGGECTADGQISIARKQLADARNTLKTLVHEVAHKVYGGSDATMTHQTALEEIWADVAMTVARHG